MNAKKIKKAIELFESSSLSRMQIKGIFGGLTLEKTAAQQPLHAALEVVQDAPQASAGKEDKHDKIIDFNYLTEVKSPMVGIFYKAPSPDLPPFVEKGSRVKKGDVICIIEAMKVMNEILSEQDGEIVDICAKDGKLVEFSQVLFRIKEQG